MVGAAVSGVLSGVFYGISGSSVKTELLYLPSFNAGYTFCISEKLDANVIFNCCTPVMLMKKYGVAYPEGTVKPDDTVATVDEYDYSSEPVKVWRESFTMLSVMADVRYKWFRSDAIRLYSAFGVGLPCINALVFYPTPYITPFGINVGSDHVYGLAELNISSAATLLLVGAGWRF